MRHDFKNEDALMKYDKVLRLALTFGLVQVVTVSYVFLEM